MPIEYRIVHQRRLVLAKGHGTLTDQGIFGYQRDVWSLPEVGGYDELVDMTQVEDIALPSTERVRALASLSADMDAPSRTSRFAIVAPSEFAFGLGRLYERAARADAHPAQPRAEPACFDVLAAIVSRLGKGSQRV